VSTNHYPSGGSGMVTYNGALHFGNGDQIWKYDGTNLTSVANVFGASFGELATFNGAIYCSARDNSAGRELWRYNGTNAVRIADIYPGNLDSNPLAFRVFNGALYFMATTNTGQGLWKYDGTNVSRVGTVTLASINNLFIYNGAICMAAATNGIDYEPWKYDGTNLSQIAQINAFNTNANVIFWTAYRGEAYFMATDGLNRFQLWKYDGTNVTRITNLGGAASGYYAYAFNDLLYFIGDDGVTGLELWKYDGSTVSQVADINPGVLGSLPIAMATYKNALMFNATDGVHGTELWRLDPISQLLKINSIKRQGNDLAFSWQTPGGMTNVLQAANGGLVNFADRSLPITAPTGDVVTVNYLDVGGATNFPSRYYRLRLEP
jgi:ELWxxDGT repeat protein